MKPKSDKPAQLYVEPYEDLLWVWNAFWRLSNTRPLISMVGPGRIQFSEIVAYATIQGWSEEKIRDFSFYLDAMDTRYMEFINEEQERDRDKRKEQEDYNRRRK